MGTYRGKKGLYEIVGEYNCEWDDDIKHWRLVDPAKPGTVLLKPFAGDEIQFALWRDSPSPWCAYATSGTAIDFDHPVEL